MSKENENKLKNCAEFAILHELGHIHLKHTDFLKNFLIILTLVISYYILIAAIVTASVAIIPSTTTFFVMLPVAFVISSLACRIFFNKVIERKKEIEADQFALSALKGSRAKEMRQGMIDYFTIAQKNSQLSWYRKILIALFDPHLSNAQRVTMAQSFVTA